MVDRVLQVLARRRSWLDRLAIGLLVFLATLIAALMGGASAQEVETVRVATFNAYLLSPIFKCGNPNFADCLAQIGDKTEQQARNLAAAILKNTDRFDIIAINEAWDEDAKRILVDKLSHDYPKYVKKIDAALIKVRPQPILDALAGFDPLAAVAIYGEPIEKIDGEDSGLMLFAKNDFEFLQLPDESFKWGSGDGETLKATTSDVGFTLYDQCGGLDCLSAKGAAIVRLHHQPSNSNYTVVFTHMQADYFDKTPPELHAGRREAQFGQIEKLVETTLSPLSPAERKRERVLVMGDLNVPLFHQPTGEWVRRFATPGKYWTDRFYDSWAVTNRADPGISNYIDGERYDYILAGPRPYLSGGIEGPICVQHVTIPVDFADLESDHNLVTADLNLGNSFCHPGIAYQVDLVKKLDPDGKPREEELIDQRGGQDLTQIRYKGSMQWFHVVRQDAGSYSIGADNPDVRIDIYQPGDMTTPISAYYGSTRTVQSGERTVTVHTYALPKEFYIRVTGKDRDYTGNYALLVRRHTCATKDEACLLQPGEAPQFALLTAAGSLLGSQDEAWYRFDVVGEADSGADQTVTVVANGLPDPDRYKATLEDFDNPHGVEPPIVTADRSRIVSDAMASGAHGYLVIHQAEAGDLDVRVSAFMQTTVRNLELKALICEDETNPELGSDDIFTLLTIDNQTRRFPPTGEREYDCDDSADHKDWGAFFGPPSLLTFVDHAEMKVIEDDGALPNDPSHLRKFPDLPAGASAIDGVRTPLSWSFDGGRYRLNYELSMRLNQPVRAAP
jgi:hypothetical protein